MAGLSVTFSFGVCAMKTKFFELTIILFTENRDKSLFLKGAVSKIRPSVLLLQTKRSEFYEKSYNIKVRPNHQIKSSKVDQIVFCETLKLFYVSFSQDNDPTTLRPLCSWSVFSRSLQKISYFFNIRRIKPYSLNLKRCIYPTRVRPYWVIVTKLYISAVNLFLS